MDLRFLFGLSTFILLNLIGNVPHGYIKDWKPCSPKFTFNGNRWVQKAQSSGSFVCISFDKIVTNEFINKYIKIFNYGGLDSKKENEFILWVPTTNRTVIESKLNNVNSYFEKALRQKKECRSSLKGLVCTNSQNAAKIVNNSNVDLVYKHIIPANSIAYIHLINTVCPCAFVSNWRPASYGTTKRAQMLNRTAPLGTSVRIKFDRVVKQSFIDDFFDALRSTHPMFKSLKQIRHGKFREEFVLGIKPGYTPQEVNTFIEKANIAIHKKMLAEISTSVNKYVENYLEFAI